jgi:hypothetical protein
MHYFLLQQDNDLVFDVSDEDEAPSSKSAVVSLFNWFGIGESNAEADEELVPSNQAIVKNNHSRVTRQANGRRNLEDDEDIFGSSGIDGDYSEGSAVTSWPTHGSTHVPPVIVGRPCKFNYIL